MAMELHAQRIVIDNFNYRDFLDFGQNKGSFSIDSQNIAIAGKESSLNLPNTPFVDFSAASNFGSLTHIGRGFVASANHVNNFDSIEQWRTWGLSTYNITREGGMSNPYGADNKFLRMDKYIVEGEANLADSAFQNTLDFSDTAAQKLNLQAFDKLLKNYENTEGKIHLYISGSGALSLYDKNGNATGSLQLEGSGERRGGGIGVLDESLTNYNKTQLCDWCTTSGIDFLYVPDGEFRNASSSGDSGSGIYAYDNAAKEWVLLGVLSRLPYTGSIPSRYAFVAKSDFNDYKANFEQGVNLALKAWNANNQGLESGANFIGFQGNKDIVFSGGGEVLVTSNILRNISGQSGGFIFADSANSVTYKFSSVAGQSFYFKGAGLDVGKNVTLEWSLRNESGDILHKVGEGTLVVKSNYTPLAGQNLGFLKVGQGSVILDSNVKLYEGIYIVSGRGGVELVSGKAEALGAIKDSNVTNSYILTQDSNKNMGIYFGSGGGSLDLKGNSLRLNTIAANDSNAVILNSSVTKSNLEIEGFGYDTNGNKTQNKTDTLIHASIGNLPTRDSQGNVTNSNATNIDIVYNGNKDSGANLIFANLIFDGNINTSGKLQGNNANITLQGHATTHAIVSNEADRNAIIQAHKNAGNPLSSDIDLSKPSSLNQNDYDTREFNFGSGIILQNSNLNVGRNAILSADITLDSNSKVTFGNNVRHFIDNKDGANIHSNGFGYYQKLESGTLSNAALINNSISYNGVINALGGVIESSISHFNATLNLSNNATLQAEYLTLDSNNSVTFSNSTGEIANLHIKDINSLNNKLNLNNSNLNITKRLIFENANVNLDSIESSLNQSGASLSKGYDITAFSNAKVSANVLNSNILAYNGGAISANLLNLSGEKNSIVVYDAGTSVNVADSINASDMESSYIIATNGAKIESKKLEFNNVKLANFIMNKDSNIIINETLSLKNSSLNMKLSDNANVKIKDLSLQDSKDSVLSLQNNARLESNSLNLNNSLLNLDSKNIIINEINLKNNSTLNYNADSKTTKSITLDNGSNLSFNADTTNIQNVTLSNNSTARFNEFSYQTQQISTDSNSALYFNSLNVGKNSKILNANANILQDLNLNDVGILGGNNGNNAAENRYHALNISQNLNLESSAKINVTFDKSVLNETNSNVEMGKFYTLLSAGNLNDNRIDKKINFTFADASKSFFMVSKVENNSIFIKFLESNPKTFIEVNKRINPAYSDIARILIEHNPNDSILDNAVSTDDYDKLNVYLSNIESNLNALSKNDLRKINTNILFSNNTSINSRVSSVRFAHKMQNMESALALNILDSKNIKVATDAQTPNPLKDSIESNLQNYKADSIAQDFIESKNAKITKQSKYRPLILNDALNNAWGSVSAGYFGGKSSMGFYSMNVGYDRLIKDTLVGVMAGYGSSNATLNALQDSSHIANFALYTHAPINNHEIASNLNMSAIFSKKTLSTKSLDSVTSDLANSTNFGLLWNLYYKYAFNLSAIKGFYQSIKPVAMMSVSAQNVGAVRGSMYKMQGYSDFASEIGVGLEYVIGKSNMYYSAQILARQGLFHTIDSINLSLSNATGSISYALRDDTTAFELNLNAAHNVKDRIYMQYNFASLVDIAGNYGIKGELKFGVLF